MQPTPSRSPSRARSLPRLRRRSRKDGHRGYLESLHEIARALLRFRGVDRLCREILVELARVVPLRSAVLLAARGGEVRERLWHAPEISSAQLAELSRRARSLHEALSGVEARGRSLDAALAGGGSESEGAVVFPLLAAEGRVFGLLQVEPKAPLDGAAFEFVSTVAAQLAAALDRHHALRREKRLRRRAEQHKRLETELRMVERAARLSSERARRRLTFLSEASAALSELAESEGPALRAVARAAVRWQAELCVIDLRVSDPGSRPITTASRRMDGEEAAQLQRQAALTALSLEERAATGTGAAPVRAVSVALRARGQRIGLLLVAVSPSGTPFEPEDVDTVRDLGRRLALAVDHARLHRRAQDELTAREGLLAMVSHDLKAPLSSILLSAAHLLSGSPATERRRRGRRQLEGILRCAEQMRHLIGDLLDLERIEAGHLTVRTTEVGATELVEQALAVIRPLAADKAIELVAQVDELPAFQADRSRVVQTLCNLLANAVKFSPERGVVSVTARRLEEAVHFSVRDAGPGLPPEQLELVFSRFWQAPGTAHLGAGLGLYICKGIVEAHRGRIWVETAPGAGATFHFTLPLAAAPAKQAPLRAPRTLPAAALERRSGALL